MSNREIEMKQFYPKYSCEPYKNYDLIHKLHHLFFKTYKGEEYMQDSVTWIVFKALLLYKKYHKDDIELIRGDIHGTPHSWLYDKKEKCFIDITGPQCVQSLEELIELGYTQDPSFSHDELINEWKKEYNDDYIVFADQYITVRELLTTLQPKGGKSKRRLPKYRKSKKYRFT